jgi:2-hydroxyglutaryl-CoA dehydratase, D-component
MTDGVNVRPDRRSGEAALALLCDRYAASRGRLAQSPAGVPVVGCIGNVIPEEIIVGAGAVPLQVAPALTPDVPAAAHFMDETATAEWRSIFSQIIAGAWASAELLVVARDYHVLYYYLKEVVRLGLGAQIPPLHLFDLIQESGTGADAYDHGEIVALVDRLVRITGRPVTQDALRAACAAANERRARQQDILDLRHAGALSSVTAFEVLGARYLMSAPEYLRAVSNVVADPPPSGGPPGRPRLVAVSAERLFHTRLHEVVEQAGATISAELDWWGSAGADAPVGLDGDPLSAIGAHYRSDVYSPQLPRSKRSRMLLHAVEQTAAHGVLFYLPPSDSELGWDVPAFGASLDALGIPFLTLRQDVLDECTVDDLRKALLGWASGLNPHTEAPE